MVAVAVDARIAEIALMQVASAEAGKVQELLEQHHILLLQAELQTLVEAAVVGHTVMKQKQVQVALAL
jgi:hypothetical protein